MKARHQALLILVALPGASFANWIRPIEIRRDTVIEVVADQDLKINGTREGDQFSVTAVESRDLPRGTQLVGEVIRVEPKTKDQAAFMDLEFRSMVLPNGSRHRIEALPISLDNRNIQRSRDGRMVANGKKVRSEYYVGGGLLGGLLVGSLLKKPFEGAFLGTLAGIILAESERSRNNGDFVMRKGSKLGAVFLQDVSLDARDTWDRDRDRDWDRNDDGRDMRPIVQFGRRTVDFTRGTEPYAAGRTTMVPLDALSRELRLEIERDGDRIYVDSDRSSIRLRVGSSDVRFRGRSLALGASVEERYGVLFVPIEALTLLTDETITVNGTEVRRPA